MGRASSRRNKQNPMLSLMDRVASHRFVAASATPTPRCHVCSQTSPALREAGKDVVFVKE